MGSEKQILNSSSKHHVGVMCTQTLVLLGCVWTYCMQLLESPCSNSLLVVSPVQHDAEQLHMPYLNRKASIPTQLYRPSEISDSILTRTKVCVLDT